MSSRVLTATNVRKHFVLHTIDGRRVDALRGVDIHADAGEHVALAGSSGAGKSSLLKAIYRTYLPDDGEVLLHRASGETTDLTTLTDQELARLRGREIGYVSQFLRAEPRRGALDIVTRAGQHRGMDRDVARDAAAASLRRLNIDESLWDVYATVLSGGQQQRVNLAAGTISAPRLLLLDEPVSALDPANREAALEWIGTLAGQGVAVIAVFHDLDAIAQLSTRVVLMRHGLVDSEGTAAEILPRLAGVAR